MLPLIYYGDLLTHILFSQIYISACRGWLMQAPVTMLVRKPEDLEEFIRCAYCLYLGVEPAQQLSRIARLFHLKNVKQLNAAFAFLAGDPSKLLGLIENDTLRSFVSLIFALEQGQKEVAIQEYASLLRQLYSNAKIAKKLGLPHPVILDILLRLHKAGAADAKQFFTAILEALLFRALPSQLNTMLSHGSSFDQQLLDETTTPQFEEAVRKLFDECAELLGIRDEKVLKALTEVFTFLKSQISIKGFNLSTSVFGRNALQLGKQGFSAVCPFFCWLCTLISPTACWCHLLSRNF